MHEERGLVPLSEYIVPNPRLVVKGFPALVPAFRCLRGRPDAGRRLRGQRPDRLRGRPTAGRAARLTACLLEPLQLFLEVAGLGIEPGGLLGSLYRLIRHA